MPCNTVKKTQKENIKKHNKNIKISFTKYEIQRKTMCYKNLTFNSQNDNKYLTDKACQKYVCSCVTSLI